MFDDGRRLAMTASPPAPAVLGTRSAPARNCPAAGTCLAPLMILVGSVGVGWIANGSPMIRNSLVIAMRTEGAGVVTSTILLTLGAMLLLRSWLRLASGCAAGDRDPCGQWLSRWWPGAPRCCWPSPYFSRDVYAYTGQGRLMAEGAESLHHGHLGAQQLVHAGHGPVLG